MILEFLGIIILGGFSSIILNRCIQRMPDDLPLFSLGTCNSCQNRLPVLLNIPLAGYWLAGKKCQSCDNPLPLQPLLIECLTFMGTIGLFLWRGYSLSIINELLLLYLLIIIAVIDWNTMTIEPRIIVGGICLRVTWIILFETNQLLSFLTGMLVAAGAFYFIGFFYETLRRRPGLGDGDAAVLGLVALWTGWQGLSLVVLLAAISGLIIGVGVLIIKKQPVGSTQIPFAPFLCLGGSLVYLIQHIDHPLTNIMKPFIFE
ncbi:MAG: prepilin peptidase [SAR324 cluster bacterium]|nr:prepilin peptidase [SAR324 cluster bacterium]